MLNISVFMCDEVEGFDRRPRRPPPHARGRKRKKEKERERKEKRSKVEVEAAADVTAAPSIVNSSLFLSLFVSLFHE
jgi:hypothetical protein